jgi:5S rRNA maturation endonuclease (ribonuclease M5)
MSALDLSKLEKAKHKEGGIIIARCPACAEQGHDKTGEHLSVWPSGKFACVQFSGPEGSEHRKRIFALVGVPDEIAGSGRNDSEPRKEFVCAYDYTDESGKQLFQVVRYKVSPPKNKTFYQRHEGESGWIWNMKGVRRVVYHLPEVIAAETVIITEGEKDADKLVSLGFVATTNVGGAEKWRPEYSEVLRGKDVIIIGDNDEQGRAHVAKLITELRGIARSLKHAPVPDKFKDVSAFIGLKLPEVAKQAINKLIGDAPMLPPAESVPARAAPVWTRPDDPSSAEVRGQIISIFTNEKFSLATKRIKIANAVVDALAGRGQFFFDIGQRNFKSTMFFDSERKHLERISDDPFHAWLSDWLRINRADPIFTHVIREIETVALNEKYSKGIVPDKFWASRPGAIYLSNGDAQLVKITGQVIAIFDNGTDDVLFATGNTLAPWKLSEPSDPFESCSAFKDANCAASHGPDLLRLWTISLPSNPAKKPPMCLVGEFGSGKTRLAEATAELYGIPFVANNVTEDFGDDDFWVSADAGGFFTLDNCDTHIKWLADAVAGAATGGHRDKRKLYTDSERYTLHARAWLCLTTANPTFASDVGLADRLLVVRMNRRNDETEDEKLSAEIKEHRDAGLSFIAQTLKKVLDDSGPVPPKLNLRHPDFAAFAAKIGRAIGRSDEVVSALQKAEKDKSLFCLENDFVASPLLDYLSQEKTFTGTASELRDALKNADPGFINKDGKPSVKTVGRRLNTLWPYLKNSLPVAEKEKDRTRVVTYTFSTTRSAEFAEFK